MVAIQITWFVFKYILDVFILMRLMGLIYSLKFQPVEAKYNTINTLSHLWQCAASGHFDCCVKFTMHILSDRLCSPSTNMLIYGCVNYGDYTGSVAALLLQAI